jgi:hypothetical protein
MTPMLDVTRLSRDLLAHRVRVPEWTALAASPGLSSLARAFADAARQRVLIEQIAGTSPSLRAVRALGSMAQLPTAAMATPFATPVAAAALKGLGMQIAPGLAASVLGSYHAAGLAAAYAPFRSALADFPVSPIRSDVGALLRSLAPSLDRRDARGSERRVLVALGRCPSGGHAADGRGRSGRVPTAVGGSRQLARVRGRDTTGTLSRPAERVGWTRVGGLRGAPRAAAHLAVGDP